MSPHTTPAAAAPTTKAARLTGREAWLWLGLLALMSCLAHLLVDLRIGIYGNTSPTLKGWDGSLAGLNALAIGMWAFTLSLAASGDRTGFAAAAVFALVHGTLGNGLISLFIAPPPSLGFPYQDVTHFGSLIFGTLAALAAWKQVRRTPGRVRPLMPLFALLVMVPIGYVTGKVRTEHLPVERGVVSYQARSPLEVDS